MNLVDHVTVHLAKWLILLRDWQMKYNPISVPTKWSNDFIPRWSHVTKSRLKRRGYEGQQCFLFRDPSAKNEVLRSRPLTTNLLKNGLPILLYHIQDEQISLATFNDFVEKDDGQNALIKTMNRYSSEYTPHSLRASIITAYLVDHKLSPVLVSKLEIIVDSSIHKLDKSSLKIDDLYEVFNDWQTKRTLTSKRVFISTSVLVTSAAWIGVDYTDLSFFGLKVSNGSPVKFLIFVLLSIIASGIFYEISKQIDKTVRRAKVNHVSNDLKGLLEPINAIDEVMKRNEIDSFNDLYYDFRSSSLSAGGHDGIDVYRAVKFYKKNLSRAGIGLSIVTILENFVVYSVAVFSIVALVMQLV